MLASFLVSILWPADTAQSIQLEKKGGELFTAVRWELLGGFN